MSLQESVELLRKTTEEDMDQEQTTTDDEIYQSLILDTYNGANGMVRPSLTSHEKKRT